MHKLASLLANAKVLWLDELRKICDQSIYLVQLNSLRVISERHKKVTGVWELLVCIANTFKSKANKSSS